MTLVTHYTLPEESTGGEKDQAFLVAQQNRRIATLGMYSFRMYDAAPICSYSVLESRELSILWPFYEQLNFSANKNYLPAQLGK